MMLRRNRPQSLNLRTPVGGIYGNYPNYYLPRRSSSRNRPRYCWHCTASAYPVVTSPALQGHIMASPAFYPVPYMIPMIYAPTPAPVSAPLLAPPMVYEEPPPLPEIPYPNYETDETETGELDELRTNTEETLSIMQRNTLRRSEHNLIRDFEETKWMSVDDNMKDVQDWTLKRNHWFQRSVELPSGVITGLRCEKLPPDEKSTLRSNNLQRLKIVGIVRQWSPSQRAMIEEEFSEIIILPQGTDMNTIEYKLQTKNIHQYSEQNFNSTLRHHSTAYNNDLDEQLFTENTVVITGKVEKVPLQETVLPTQIWSKEYKQTVKGTVDLSAEGRVINPTITSYSELPDALVKLAPTPDQDTSYAVLDGGCQVRIHLDDNVDRNSIQLQVDPIAETLKVVFTRHSEDGTKDIYTDDDQPTTTTNYDMQVSQTFELSAKKFDINGISKNIQERDLLLFIPFAKGFHPSSLNM